MPIEGTKGYTIVNVNFDAQGSTYAVGRASSDHHFFKLNPSNEISVVDLPYDVDVVRTSVSSRGDAYFEFIYPDNLTLGILRANATEVEKIGELSFRGLFYLNNNDNFFYSKEKGIFVIRPGSSESFSIINLEDFSSSGLAVTDKSGNTYLSVKNKANSYLALITKEALLEEQPYAIFLNFLENETFAIQDLMIDEDNNLWVSAHWEKGIIARLVNGNWETIIMDPVLYDNKMVRSKERIYIIAADFNSTARRIYYITSNDQIIEIPELNNLIVDYRNVEGIADGEGQVYFVTSYEELSSSLGKLITIKPDESKPIAITFESDPGKEQEFEAKLDFNNDLWFRDSIVAFYHLKKGEIVPELVNSDGTCFGYWGIDVNFITEKVYISCGTGLYVVTNE